jgi:hypothetical protein
MGAGCGVGRRHPNEYQGECPKRFTDGSGDFPSDPMLPNEGNRALFSWVKALRAQRR